MREKWVEGIIADWSNDHAQYREDTVYLVTNIRFQGDRVVADFRGLKTWTLYGGVAYSLNTSTSTADLREATDEEVTLIAKRLLLGEDHQVC